MSETQLFKEIERLKDASALQADLKSITCWSEGTGLQFNKEKCHVQSVTRKKKPINFYYNLNGVPLKTTHCEQDLGVCVSADLTWKDQVMGQAAQAMKHFGYIMQIWSPQSVDLVLKLEKFNKGLLDTSWRIYHLLVVKILSKRELGPQKRK